MRRTFLRTSAFSAFVPCWLTRARALRACALSCMGYLALPVLDLEAGTAKFEDFILLRPRAVRRANVRYPLEPSEGEGAP